MIIFLKLSVGIIKKKLLLLLLYSIICWIIVHSDNYLLNYWPKFDDFWQFIVIFVECEQHSEKVDFLLNIDPTKSTTFRCFLLRKVLKHIVTRVASRIRGGEGSPFSHWQPGTEALSGAVKSLSCWLSINSSWTSCWHETWECQLMSIFKTITKACIKSLNNALAVPEQGKLSLCSTKKALHTTI